MEKVKVTKRDVITATKALLQIGNTPVEGRTAYWLGRNLTNLGRIEKEVMKKRSEIIKRFGDLKKAEEEFNKILDEEIEVEIMKVNVSSFGKVGMNSLVAIDFMVDAPESATIVRVK